MKIANFTKEFRVVFQNGHPHFNIPPATYKCSYHSTYLSILDIVRLLNFCQSRGIKCGLDFSNGVGLLSD